MKKLFALLLTIVISVSFVACGSKVETIKGFDNLDTSKFFGFINGDGDLTITYEGVIDEAVIDATLTDENGASIKITNDLLSKNGDGWSSIFFAECNAEAGDNIQLTLSKDGYNELSFTLDIME